MPASTSTNVKNLKCMQQTVLLYLQEKAEASLSMQNQGEKTGGIFSGCINMPPSRPRQYQSQSSEYKLPIYQYA